MNRIALLLTVSTLLLTGYCQAQTEKTELYESEQGRFKVRFLSKPKIDTKDLATGKAGTPPIPTVTERSEASSGAYIAVVYADYPEEFKNVTPKKLFDGVRDGLKGKDGKVTTDVDVKFTDETKPSYREIRIEAGNNVIRARVFMVGSRLYQVMVTGDKKSTAHKSCDVFLDSFELVK